MLLSFAPAVRCTCVLEGLNVTHTASIGCMVTQFLNSFLSTASVWELALVDSGH